MGVVLVRNEVLGDVGVGGDDLGLGRQGVVFLELKVADGPREREIACVGWSALEWTEKRGHRRYH